MTTHELITKMALDAWTSNVSRADKLFNELSDEQLQAEVSANRNSGVYLLGHLTAVHDSLFPLFGLGERRYPQLEALFIKTPEKAIAEKPTVASLRNAWTEVNTQLAKHFNEITPEEWFQKHTAVSTEDFANEPHRNRLNVLMGRTNHLNYHLGQLVFLKK